MENNAIYTPATSSIDMSAAQNTVPSARGQPVAQRQSGMPGATLAIRGPQHSMVVPQQLMAPLFPVGAVLSNPGALLANVDMYPPMGMIAHGQGTASSAVPIPAGYQHLAAAPTTIAAAFAPESYSNNNQNKQEKGSSVPCVADYSTSDRAKQNRDRNREHARSTRLRKKAYVAKLKDLVDGLHSQRTEDMRQRRVAIQHLSDVQGVRRNVVRTFLNHFSSCERDERKWTTLIEDKFWLKEPVTPYRSFRRAEIEKDCHISKGLNSVICNAASLAVMIESIGSGSARWMQLKRQDVMVAEEAQRGTRKVPLCLVQQPSRLQHAISSLSSSSAMLSGEDIASASDEKAEIMTMTQDVAEKASKENVAKVSSSSGSSNGGCDAKEDTSNQYHDYDAKPLPDPKLDEVETKGSSSEGSPDDYGDSGQGGDCRSKSSSVDASAPKRRKIERDAQSSGSTSGAIAAPTKKALGPSIARKGGIPHNIIPIVDKASSTSDRLKNAPAVVLPPFTGLGKRSGSVLSQLSKTGSDSGSRNGNTTALSNADGESSSLSSESNKTPRTTAHFHINEDDMIMMDSVLMCPFVFRSSDAVFCGALSECVMPGMLRANFSNRNKLLSLEMVYDSMGFMQQLERANGNNGAAQIVPNSLEMALTPSSTEARIITLAKSPFLIVNVNDLWTQTTGYTQMEVEGKPYLALLDGDATFKSISDVSGKSFYDLDEVAKGRSACMANIHYDKHGKDFIEFVCSYPLTNSNDETTHLLHVSKELPSDHGASSSAHLPRLL